MANPNPDISKIADAIEAGYRAHDRHKVDEAMDLWRPYQLEHEQNAKSMTCDRTYGPRLRQLTKELEDRGILRRGEEILGVDVQQHRFLLNEGGSSIVPAIMTDQDPHKRYDPKELHSKHEGVRTLDQDEIARRQREDEQRRLHDHQVQLQQQRADLERQRQELARRDEELARQQQEARMRQEQMARAQHREEMQRQEEMRREGR